MAVRLVLGPLAPAARLLGALSRQTASCEFDPVINVEELWEDR